MFLRFEREVRRKRVRSDYMGARPRRLKPDAVMQTALVAVCACDQCKREFRTSNHPQRKEHAPRHFCSSKCRSDAFKQGGVLYRHDIALIRPDVLKRACVASHSVEATQRRSESLKAFHERRPEGWQNPGNTPEACQKRHETMKRNGTYRKSRPEDELHGYLTNKFGEVERNRLVNGRWPIDFYVPAVDAYVQLDGVYWHGLDRPLAEIRASTKSRDRVIVKKWEIDRAQDVWFEEHGMRLVRITDVAFLKGDRPL